MEELAPGLPTYTPTPIGDPAGATANGAIFQLFIILVEDCLDFTLKALVIWYISEVIVMKTANANIIKCTIN